MLQSGHDTDLDMADISKLIFLQFWHNHDLTRNVPTIQIWFMWIFRSSGSCGFFAAVVEDSLLLGYDRVSSQKNIILILDYD
jgi:hypothetical protein